MEGSGATGSPAALEVRALLAGGVELATCDVMRMEVLAGARGCVHLAELRAVLARCVSLPLSAEDHEAAASPYRTSRHEGETVRKLIDCLIGATAIRHDAPLLHCDADCDALVRHSALPTHPLP